MFLGAWPGSGLGSNTAAPIVSLGFGFGSADTSAVLVLANSADAAARAEAVRVLFPFLFQSSTAQINAEVFDPQSVTGDALAQYLSATANVRAESPRVVISSAVSAELAALVTASLDPTLYGQSLVTSGAATLFAESPAVRTIFESLSTTAVADAIANFYGPTIKGFSSVTAGEATASAYAHGTRIVFEHVHHADPAAIIAAAIQTLITSAVSAYPAAAGLTYEAVDSYASGAARILSGAADIAVYADSVSVMFPVITQADYADANLELPPIVVRGQALCSQEVLDLISAGGDPRIVASAILAMAEATVLATARDIRRVSFGRPVISYDGYTFRSHPNEEYHGGTPMKECTVKIGGVDTGGSQGMSDINQFLKQPRVIADVDFVVPRGGFKPR